MLHPFFSYFGSKYRMAKHYPKPLYKVIVEPFAGAAGYSLRYPEKKVILYDTYEPVVMVWDYLIKAKKEEILSLPLSCNGHPFCKEYPVSDCNIAEEAKILIGFWLTESQTSPSRYPLSKSRGGNWTERKRALIANQVEHIKHWKVKKLSYEEIEYNHQCTWFIDPPYSQAGKRYRNNAIDYPRLAEWCKDRRGQTIVCEQSGANWLEFSTFHKASNGSNKKYEEVIWTNDGNPMLHKVNKATIEELVNINGIGEKSAKKIVANTPFDSPDGLKKLKLRGKSLKALQNWIAS